MNSQVRSSATWQCWPLVSPHDPQCFLMTMPPVSHCMQPPICSAARTCSRCSPSSMGGPTVSRRLVPPRWDRRLSRSARAHDRPCVVPVDVVSMTRCICLTNHQGLHSCEPAAPSTVSQCPLVRVLCLAPGPSMWPQDPGTLEARGRVYVEQWWCRH